MNRHIKRTTYSILKKSEINSLLKIINSTEKVNSSKLRNKKSKKEWIWQYKDLPSSKSYCYIAKKQKKIVGYYHVPTFKFKFKNNLFLIGNAQDVGILKRFRGQGIFKNLSNFAIKDLSRKIDLIYSFPNQYSIKNFINNNSFNFIKNLPIYFKPIFLIKKRFKNLEGMKITELSNTNADLINLFKNFGSKHLSYLVRDKSFLQWRYIKSQKGKINILGLKSKNKLQAAIFYKYEKIFGLKSIVILDFAYINNVENLSRLIDNFSYYLYLKKKIGFHLVIISGIFKDMNIFFKKNFYKIPMILSPRKIILLSKVFNKKITKDFKKSSSWLVTLGDWDIF